MGTKNCSYVVFKPHDMNIQLINESDFTERFYDICEKWKLKHNPSSNLALVQTNERLELRKLNQPKLGAVAVNFVDGKMSYRRKFGGGRNEAIVKAVGVKGSYTPTIIDATAGLGQDAFVLASIGCYVKLIERNPIVGALLEDGLQRAYKDLEIGHFMRERMVLLPHSSITGLNPDLDSVDVVYLDPMYPSKTKSALVKKEMQLFQQLIGCDLDSDDLLFPAQQLARKRVVVKRPNYALFLANKKPDFCKETKKHRFDIYLSH